MIDFRYHALSLVSVFLALALGIVLGVTLGDSLVSEADKGVRQSLRGDVVEAREGERGARRDLSARDGAIKAAFPFVASGRLRGRRVAIVGVRKLPHDVESSVTGTVEDAGGRIGSVSLLDVPDELDGIATAAGERYRRAGSETRVARRLGLRVGRALVRGGPLAGRLAERLDGRVKGDLHRAGAAVLYRAEPPEPSGDGGKRDRERRRAEVAEAFEEGLISALRGNTKVAVGVEESDPDPSQAPFFTDRDLSTVEGIDLYAGRTALVLVLAGAKGSFGLGSHAKSPLPDPAQL